MCPIETSIIWSAIWGHDIEEDEIDDAAVAQRECLTLGIDGASNPWTIQANLAPKILMNRSQSQEDRKGKKVKSYQPRTKSPQV